MSNRITYGKTVMRNAVDETRLALVAAGMLPVESKARAEGDSEHQGRARHNRKGISTTAGWNSTTNRTHRTPPVIRGRGVSFWRGGGRMGGMGNSEIGDTRHEESIFRSSCAGVMFRVACWLC